MPVPTAISDLSQTAGSNSPPGSESPTTADNYLRQYAAFIAMLRDGIGFTDPVQLASGATTDIGGQNSMFVEITGTTTITSFSTNYNGPRFLRFTGALVLTHNATTLNLPGAANITTADGDRAVAIPNQAGNGWNVYFYTRADGSWHAPTFTAGTVAATTALTLASKPVGHVLLGSVTASASATLDFTSMFDSTKYSAYEVYVVNLLPATDGTDPYIRFSNDNGATFSATGYTHSRTTYTNNPPASAVSGSGSDTKIVVTSNIDNADAPMSGRFTIIPGTYTQVNWQANQLYGDGATFGRSEGGGMWNGGVANAFRILMSSGNITSGTVYVYGLRKS